MGGCYSMDHCHSTYSYGCEPCEPCDPCHAPPSCYNYYGCSPCHCHSPVLVSPMMATYSGMGYKHSRSYKGLQMCQCGGYIPQNRPPQPMPVSPYPSNSSGNYPQTSYSNPFQASSVPIPQLQNQTIVPQSGDRRRPPSPPPPYSKT